MSARQEITFPLLTLILFSLLSALGLEAAFRIYHGAWLSTDSLTELAIRLPDAGPLIYDAELGYVSGSGVYRRKGWSKSTDADGFRRSGGKADAPGLPILAVGDSFTFGDEVDDHHTWPAQLESRLGRRVLNAGVSGYGLDQAVLRAERVLARRELAAVVLAFIAADIDRTELSYRSFAKPYFEIEDGELVLRNSPVPREPPPDSVFNHTLRRSYLARFALRRVASDWWHLDHRRVEHDRGPEVSAALIQRLHRRSNERGVPLVLISLAGQERDLEGLDPLIESARASGIRVIDLAARIVALGDAIGDERAFAPGGHLSPSSNAWVAEQLAREFEKLR